MSLKDDLIAARALIDTPEKWVRGLFEKDGCFCVLGAALKVTRESRDDSILFYLHRALPDAALTVPTWNDADTTTHADILALFDRAIEAAS